MVPRRQPRPATGLPRRVECAGLTGCALTADRRQIASRRAWKASRPRQTNPVQVETLTTQQVHRVCAVGSVSALASNPQAAGDDPAGFAWSVAWIHNSGAPMHHYILYYNRAAVLACTASGVALVSGYALDGVWAL